MLTNPQHSLQRTVRKYTKRQMYSNTEVHNAELYEIQNRFEFTYHMLIYEQYSIQK
jgi:hypothetical protein